MLARTELIVALDIDSPESALKFVDAAGDSIEWFKVGSQLFCIAGPDFVRALKKRGKKIFLDLKFHDIPNTVAKAAGAATRLGVDMFNVHASGGRKMMAAAVAAVKENTLASQKPPILLAVTVLTSLDDAELGEILDKKGGCSALSHVKHLAKLAKDSGVNGVVSSAHEIDIIRKTCGDDFVLAVPGIRPSGSAKDDQERIMTPAEAARKGADFIVVGRPILKAENPAEVAKAVREEIRNALVGKHF